jgi:hypothetical protein
MRERAPLTDEDLALLREAAEADFHATPATVLSLLDMVDDLRERNRWLVEQLFGHDERMDELTADVALLQARVDLTEDQVHEWWKGDDDDG